jgi:hypothetical protein
MERDFLKRTRITALILTAIIGIYATAYVSLLWAVQYAVTSCLSIVNFWLIEKLVVAMLGERNKIKTLIWAVVKLPLLYFVAFLFFHNVGCSISSFLAGFNTIFIVLILKAAGKMYIEASQPQQNQNTRMSPDSK